MTTINYCYDIPHEGRLYDLRLFYDRQWILEGDKGGGCTCSDSTPLKTIIEEADAEKLISDILACKDVDSDSGDPQSGYHQIILEKESIHTKLAWGDGSGSRELEKIAQEMQQWARRSNQ